jgi:prepilin-type N-terminal cleavage/methylation domain-containing protein
MATKKRSLKLFLYKLWNNSQPRKNSGFTLIELMVALAMSSLVIAALLGMLVQLVQTDQGESARNQTQQEMQLALNYIVDDLRDAVYVYGSDCHRNDTSSCPQFAKFIPNFGTNVEPVLAFWKAKPLDQDDLDQLPADCNTFADQRQQAECSNLKIKRRAYSLVVYLQSTESGSTSPWKGKSRLIRYELPKYKSEQLATLTRSIGFVDPSENQNNFVTWPYDSGNNLQTPGAGGRPDKNQDGWWAVLVDFVDDPSNTTPAPSCPNPDPAKPIYSRIPNADPTKRINYTSNSFFVCVRNTVDDNNGGQNQEVFEGQNQDVILYLRGNPKDRFSFLNTTSDLQMLQTQVTIGGVIDKTPK